MKRNIIVVGDYNREDFLYVAKVLHEDFNIYFLEYFDKVEVINNGYCKWGKAIYWKDFKSALTLLEVVNPKFVLFYFIESYNHVALNVSCKFKKVPTYHIEHGIRNYDLLQNEPTLNVKREHFFGLTKILQIRKRLKGRLFLLNTIKELPKEHGLFLKNYFQVRKSNNIFETFRIVKNKLRIADCYISFSPKIFEFHKKADHLPDDYPVHFIGCPSFDSLAKFNEINKVGGEVLFIDNAFESQNLFGWTIENKISFLDSLIDTMLMLNKKVWIKSHPYSDERVYEKFKKQDKVVFSSTNERLEEALQNCNIIIGFYSTLLMPLVALYYTTCFSLEMNPQPRDFDNSKFLTSSGAIKKITNWNELIESIESIETEHKNQVQNKLNFVKNWMYMFDGKSSERLRTIFVSDPVS